MSGKVLLLNGPNLNLLGSREPEKYGTATLNEITGNAASQCQRLGLMFDHLQTNHEGVMLDRVHQARSDGTSFIVINAGAWTHTSVALVDALAGINVPFVEVHVSSLSAIIICPDLTPTFLSLFSLPFWKISNTHKREPFRHHSYLSAKAVGMYSMREDVLQIGCSHVVPLSQA